MRVCFKSSTYLTAWAASSARVSRLLPPTANAAWIGTDGGNSLDSSTLLVGLSTLHRDTLEQVGFGLLEQVLDSPVASPLVWYDEVFDEVIQEYVAARDRHAIDLRVRQLAHLLRFNAGTAGRDINVRFVLCDLGEAFLYLGEYERGLSLFAALVRNDSTDIWVYNALAFVAGDVGWPRLGAEAARRGLALLAAEGDPEELHDQLTEQVEHLEAGSEVDSQDELSAVALADLRAALTTDFVPGPHQPPAVLARSLVPELADAFVKQPASAPASPPVHAGGLSTKLGRNEPCWCGSGKKYKHCHMVSLEDLHCSGVRWCIAVTFKA
jgi:hypothetical protein